MSADFYHRGIRGCYAWQAHAGVNHIHRSLWSDDAVVCCQVSLVHWNQDEEFGGFGGPHCMVMGGYSPILEGMASRLDVRLSCPVTTVAETSNGVSVMTASGVRSLLMVPLPSSHRHFLLHLLQAWRAGCDAHTVVARIGSYHIC